MTKAIQLPPPRSRGPLSLEEALLRRRSIRELASTPPLSWDQIGQLLWAAQGLMSPEDVVCTAPSAGATYPLDLYVATRDGVFHYEPRRHELVQTVSKDVRRDLQRAALDQSSLDAPAVFSVTAVPARTAARYGDRAARYVPLEAGHAAQNLLLQVAALDLAAVPVGAFDDARVHAILGLTAAEVPLYLIPVGRPRLPR